MFFSVVRHNDPGSGELPPGSVVFHRPPRLILAFEVRRKAHKAALAYAEQTVDRGVVQVVIFSVRKCRHLVAHLLHPPRPLTVLDALECLGRDVMMPVR